MKTAFVVCVLALLPTLAAADYVATEEEEAAMRARIAKNPPTAETLTAQPYPGAKLDPVCSAAQSAPRQPQMMVYCFYTRDPIDKVQAHLDGPGKPDPAVYVRADRGNVVDAQSRVTIADITKIAYYVNVASPTAKQPAAATTSSRSNDADSRGRCDSGRARLDSGGSCPSRRAARAGSRRRKAGGRLDDRPESSRAGKEAEGVAGVLTAVGRPGDRCGLFLV